MSRYLLTVTALVTALGVGAYAGEVVPIPVPVPPKADEKKDDKEKPKEDKPKGPDHSVTLNEESGVLELLNKARKAREKAETDPQVWPECVKHYAEIIKKYPNTVYLDRWEGPDKKEMFFKNGLYRSTRERVAQEIASLPANGLAIYRVINDPAARAMFQDAQEQFDERKMEQVARDYYSTSWGDDALAWLGELACDRGAYRQGLMRMAEVLKHPTPSIPKLATLQRLYLAQVKSGDRVAAEKTLKEIDEAAKDPQNGKLRLGHTEGPAVLEKLKAKLATVQGAEAQVNVADRPVFWETYFGNAQHNLLLPKRQMVGIKKWTVPIRHLIYGPSVELVDGESITGPDGNAEIVRTMNHHIISREGYFYICDGNALVAYPVGNPKPGQASAGGNAKFVWPADIDAVRPRPQPKNQARWSGEFRIVRHHPYFCTIANQRLYAVCGGDGPDMPGWRGGGQEHKAKPNYIVALGRQGATGSLESGKLVWSLQPESAAFQSHSKADQEWLRSIFFVTAPTYETGALYALAVSIGSANEAWLASFDADTGHLLWRTSLCSAQGMSAIRVQPDLGLAPTVANGVVYACTNLGAVAAVDAVSGGIKWLRIYDRIKVQQTNFWDRRNLPSEFWAPNAPILQGNMLFVAPQDSEILYAYDIETGRRIWEVQRVSVEGDDALKHILGLYRNTLIVTGEKQLHFINVKSGRRATDSITFRSGIRGRGAVTDGMVLVPTETTLERVEIGSNAEGGFAAKALDPHVWEKKDDEAGNVIVSGDILFTVSSKYVNAFFVFEDMEKRLRERVEKRPDDLLAYIELADIYQRIEKYDQAVAEMEKALAVAEKVKAEPQAAEAIININSRLIDALSALGERAQSKNKDFPAANEYFKRAFETAKRPNVPRELAVSTLRQLAENAVSREDLPGAVAHLQVMIENYGDVVYTFAEAATRKARLYAESRIDELKRKDAKAYEKIEADAAAALTQAGDDAVKLQAMIARYPNADASGQGLLKLAQTTLQAEPEQARLYARRYLGRFSADAALAAAIVASSYERSGLDGPAYTQLFRIVTQAQFAGKTLPVDPADLTQNPAAPLDVVAWAKKRLEQPQYLRPSQAVLSMGSGKLKQAWSATVNDKQTVVTTQGVAPLGMRRGLLYIVNNELLALSAESRGEQIWTAKPKVPENCNGRGIWMENLLLLAGNREIVAFDSRADGRVVWRYSIPNAGGAVPEIRSGDRHIAFVASGMLIAIEAMSGAELWREQIEGNAIIKAPVCGEGFVAVLGMQPAKLYIFGLESGKKHAATPAQSGAYLDVQPLANDDKVFVAEKDSLKCFSGLTGKLIWAHAVAGNVTHMRASRGLLLAGLNQREVVAFNIEGEGERKAWAALLPSAASVTDLRVDGDDLYVALNNQGNNRKASIAAYSVKAQGKFMWEQEVHLQAIDGALSDHLIATSHLILIQNNWDLTNNRPTAVVLVDRKNGKLTWDANLASDTVGMNDARPTFSFQTFDGGIVVTDGKRRVAYLGETGSTEQQLNTLVELVAKTPKDINLRLKLAAAQLEKGDGESALNRLNELLGENLDEARFAEVYERLMLARREVAAKQKTVLNFARVEKAPALDGNLNDWTAIPEAKLGQWRHVMLPLEEDPRATPKKAAWKGGEDLNVTFRGAYDDKNLYICVVVTDDKHKNDQTDPSYGDLGDSLRLFFDINRDGGMGYRGEDFELGACLNKENQPLGWKWVEHGKYLRGAQKLETGVFVARKENQTVYQIAIPLAYLTLNSEAGRKFGFSFVVNDQDEGNDVAKSMAPTPGVSRPTWPGLFGEGVLQGK